MSFGSKDPEKPTPPPQSPTQANAAMQASGSLFGKQSFNSSVGRQSLVNTGTSGLQIKAATPGRKSLLGGN
jgi:hypothetical protein